MIVNKKIVANALRNAVQKLIQDRDQDTLDDVLALIKQLEEL